MKRALVFCVVLHCLLPALLLGQTIPKATDDDAMAARSYSSLQGGNVDSIDVWSGGLSIHVPLIDYPQRGSVLRRGYSLHYGSKLLQCCKELISQTADGGITSDNYWPLLSTQGGVPTVVSEGAVQLSWQPIYASTVGSYNRYYVKFSIVTADQANHLLGGTAATSTGATTNTNTTLYQNGPYLAVDSSGWRLDVSSNFTQLIATGPDGVKHYFPSIATFALSPTHTNMAWLPEQYRVDTNGNTIYESSPGTDTIGRAQPTTTSTSDFSGCTGPLPISTATVFMPPGSGSGFKECYVTLQVQTSASSTFNPFNALTAKFIGSTYSNQKQVLQSLILPNGTAWTFEYNDRDAGDPSTVNYGNVTKVIFPTGGSISYTYRTEGTSAAAGSDCTPVTRKISTRTVDDGTGPHTWQYTDTVVTDPLGNDTVYTFSGGSECTLLETERKYYSGSQTAGQLLKTVDTAYVTWSNAGLDRSTPGAFKSSATVTWANGNTSKTTYTPDNGFTFYGTFGGYQTQGRYGKTTQSLEYDYGQGASGSLLREVDTQYRAFNNSSYLAKNLLNLVDSVITKNASGTTLAQVSYGYDEANGSPQGVYGNQTSVTQWLNTGTSPKSQSVFNSQGMVVQKIDPKGNSTAITYDSTGLYATKIQSPDTNGVHHIDQFAYDFNTGLLTSHTDQNGQVTSVAYDTVERPIQVVRPDTGTVTRCYSDEGAVAGYLSCSQSSAPYSSVTTAQVAASLNEVSTDLFDGLGRLNQHQLDSDPDGATYTDTSYDALGRAYKNSNPHRSQGSSTDGTVQNTFDGLGRVISVTEQDGSIATTDYSAFPCVTVRDEAGHARKTCSDALGRIAKVFEDPSGVNYETDYQYDALGNLTCAEQHGGVSGTGCSANPSNDATSPWRVRRFTYDSLSRLLTATNPESGIVQYAYDADSNVTSKASPAQNGASGTVTIYYCFDALNRLTAKDYASQTCSSPAATYGYDAGANGIGRRTSMTDSSGSTSWSYDVMGRMISESRTILGVNKTISATYNYDGSLASVRYPSGHVVNYTPGGAGRVLSVYDSTRSYPFVGGANGGGYVSYTPTGALSAATLGGKIDLTNTYNQRLQPLTLQANGLGGTLMSRTYDFGVGVNNGAVHGITDGLDSFSLPGRPIGSATFVYDTLNRLAQAQSTGTDCSSAGSTTMNWGNTYTVDPWGNLTNKGPVTGLTGCMTESLSQSVGVNNRISGTNVHDAAGNMIQNGALVYDKENRLSSAGGVTYVYDGDGERVAKTGATTMLYWTGVSNAIVAESDGSGNLTSEYVFFNGGRLSRIDSPATTPVAHYYVADNLGSATVIANEAGALEREEMYFPYGGERWSQGSDTNRYKFTGKERDAESAGIVGGDGLDYFGARYYSTTGRFLSPDWAARPTAVPYAVFGDPQSLNLYGYVRNDPLSRIDADGHYRKSPGDCPDYCPSHDLTQKKADDKEAQQQEQKPPQAPPKGPDGKPTPPPVPVPGAPNLPWKWYPNPQNPRGGIWGPDGWKGPNPPNGSWDPDGHWDINGGKGQPVDHYDPKGNPITPDQAHPGNRPAITPRGPGPEQQRQIQNATAETGTVGTVLIILYWLASELN